MHTDHCSHCSIHWVIKILIPLVKTKVQCRRRQQQQRHKIRIRCSFAPHSMREKREKEKADFRNITGNAVNRSQL